MAGEGSRHVDSSHRTDEHTSCNKILPYCLNILLILMFFVSLMTCGAIPAFVKNGFFCNDSSIRHPFGGETINFLVLWVVAFIIPAVVISGCDRKLRNSLSSYIEFCNSKLEQKSNIISAQSCNNHERREYVASVEVARRSAINASADPNENSSKARVDEIPDVVNDAHSKDQVVHQKLVHFIESEFLGIPRDFQIFWIGGIANNLLTGLGKLAMGRLRPNFIQRCNPNVDCSDRDNFNRYIDDFTCTNDLKYSDLIFITTSWPSGHASSVFFAATYLIFYLNTVIPVMKRLDGTSRSKCSLVMLFALDVIFIGVAGYISITRVTDFHHHVSDVLSGAIIGAVTASASFCCISKFNHTRLLDYLK